METFHGKTCHLPTNNQVYVNISGGQKQWWTCDRLCRDEDLLTLTLYPTHQRMTTLRQLPSCSRATSEAQGFRLRNVTGNHNITQVNSEVRVSFHLKELLTGSGWCDQILCRNRSSSSRWHVAPLVQKAKKDSSSLDVCNNSRDTFPQTVTREGFWTPWCWGLVSITKCT